MRYYATCLGAALVTLACPTASANPESVDDAKAALLAVIATYEPGGPVTDALTARITAAADALEQAAGAPPDLHKTPELADGQWRSLFSSQGIVGEIDVAFMTRALPGGGKRGGKATSHVVLQELRPTAGFYRNTMVMTAGENDTPLLHLATAELGIADDKPNDLTVRFRQIDFVPGRADVTPADLRTALGLGAGTPLTITVPVDPERPPSRSTVTYLDGDIRINRGERYIAVLQKIQ